MLEKALEMGDEDLTSLYTSKAKAPKVDLPGTARMNLLKEVYFSKIQLTSIDF